MTHRLDGGFFRSAIENSLDCIRVLDPEGRVLFINHAGLAAFEIHKPADVVGRRCADLWPEPARGEIERGIAAARRGQTHRFEGECPTLGGTLKWWDVVIAPVPDADGGLAGVMTTSRDITELRRSRVEGERQTIELARSAAALRSAFRIAHVGGWEVDFVDGQTSFSPELCELLGSPPLPPLPIAEANNFWIEDDRDRFRLALEGVEKRCERLSFEGRAAGANGELRHWQLFGEPVIVEGRCVALRGAGQDITEWREMLERERQALQAADAMSGFLATMSHEIRTPLNGVLGMAQAMALGELSPVQRDRLQVIETSGSTLLRLLDDLLDLSKMEAGKVQLEIGTVDIGEIADGARSLFDALTQNKDIALNLSIAPAAAGCWRGDPVRVRQILHNLISNAVKFTEHGSISVGISRDDQALMLTVRDTGIGIAADALTHVFDKFVQADASMTRRFGGSGLGLTISRDLAIRMGGDIEVDSVVGVGTTFTVRLPIERIEEALPREPVAPAPAAEGLADVRLRVLAAEDNPVNQLVLKTLLGGLGIEPVIVENGRKAYEAWRAEPWDIILMDIQMPEVDGVAAAHLIRNHERREGRARTPIIALTANVMAHQKDEYLAAGMDAVVAKPLSLSVLVQTMEDALAPSEVIPERLTG